MGARKAAWDKFIVKMNELDISEGVIKTMSATEIKELLVEASFSAIDKAQILSAFQEYSLPDTKAATAVVQRVPKPSAKNGFGNRMVSDDVTQTQELPPANLFPADYRPSLPAHQSLQELNITDHDEIIEWCLRRMEDMRDAAKKYSLTDDEILSIILYTYDLGISVKREENIYFKLNYSLRFRAETLLKWRDYLWYLLNALRKLPVHQGEVYRGVNVKLSPDAYKKGKQVRWNAFTSTSMTKSVAENFMAVKHAYIANSSILSLYASGRTTGLVVECGDGVSHTSAIVEGYEVPNTSCRLDLGGKDITDNLGMLHFMRVPADAHLTSCHEIMRGVKESVAFVSQDIAKDSKSPPKRYSLPDGKEMVLSDECFRCAEPLFDPNILRIKSPGIHQLAYSTLKKSDDLQTLAKNIVLSGGTTMLSGFGERLHKELSVLVPKKMELKVIAPPERKVAPFIGGSILGSLSTFQDMWIVRREYEENGASVVRKILQ